LLEEAIQRGAELLVPEVDGRGRMTVIVARSAVVSAGSVGVSGKPVKLPMPYWLSICAFTDIVRTSARIWPTVRPARVGRYIGLTPIPCISGERLYAEMSVPVLSSVCGNQSRRLRRPRHWYVMIQPTRGSKSEQDETTSPVK
jgi:hypothetical protein